MIFGATVSKPIPYMALRMSTSSFSTSKVTTPRVWLMSHNSMAGTGNDLIDLTSARFNYGATLVNGGTGNDWLLGNSGNDRLFGVAGNDYLKGYGGKDYLNGGDNNDRLYGGRGNDKLNGGSGNDYLYGEFGKDTLTGGKGTRQVRL